MGVPVPSLFGIYTYHDGKVFVLPLWHPGQTYTSMGVEYRMVDGDPTRLEVTE